MEDDTMVASGGHSKGRLRVGIAGAVLLVVLLMAWVASRPDPGSQTVPLPLPVGTRPAPQLKAGSSLGSPAEVNPVLAPSAAQEKSIQVRRLYDGSPVPDLIFRLRSGLHDPGVQEMTTTDSEGRFTGEPSDLVGAVPDGFRWIAVNQTAEEITSTLTFWVYDRVRIRAVVELEPRGVSTDFAGVTLKAMLGVSDTDGVPWTEAWLRSHRVGPGPIDGREEVDSPGRYSVLVPRLKSATAIAWRPGWRPSTAALDLPPEAPEMEVRLSLSPGLLIEGVLTDEHGTPIPNAVVDVFVVRWIPWDMDKPIPPEMARVFSPNGGIGIGGTKDGRLHVRVRERAVTDKEGRFRTYTKSEGRIGLYVNEVGRGGIRTLLGDIQSDVTGIELSASSVKGGPWVSVSNGGIALGGRELNVEDCTDPLHPSLVYPVDAEGRVPAAWFQSGHQYHIHLARDFTSRGFLRWDGRESIDLADLPRECEEVD
jgi:hypothetical protein